MKLWVGLLCVTIGSLVSVDARAQTAKNVIYLVADGNGYQTIEATGYYNGNFGGELFRGPGWVNAAMSTYALRTGTTPVAGAAGLLQDPTVVYDSTKAWDPTPQTPGDGLEFAGYDWAHLTAPDSASTASASMTGQKTYNGAINVDGNGNALATFAALAHLQRGMRTGIVTTAPFTDATPAAMSGVSNTSRLNRGALADQMLAAPYIDVLMGAGNPDYDDDGNLLATPSNTWVAPSTWADLKDGDANGVSASWQLIESKGDFDNLAAGSLAIDSGKKVLGVVTAHNGKQSYRTTGGPLGPNYSTLPGVGWRTDVPELSTMVEGAIGLLEGSPDGFFLGIEQGEVDVAMHANHLGRAIEAKQEFDATLAWLDLYLTANAGDANLPNYDNTLVVVTSDHDHLLYGADGDTVPFDLLDDHGAGNLPGALFQWYDHSNQLVPLFAKGAGSELIGVYADQFDSFGPHGRGFYLDQSELFDVFVEAAAVPEPSSLVLAALGASAVCLVARRRHVKPRSA